MSDLGTINGVRVISAATVPWLDGDDEHVKRLCDARGLVLFDAGGKSDAVVVGGRAIIWERQGERFRSFPVDVPALRRGPLADRWWSVAVPGCGAGDMVRIACDPARDDAAVELTRGGYIVVVRLPLSELRALVGVITGWPGVSRGG